MARVITSVLPWWPARHAPGWSPGIRARLFLLALVTLSPVAVVLVFQDYYHLTAARQRADAEASRLALLKAGELDHHLLAIETQITALRALVPADGTRADGTREPADGRRLAETVEELPGYIEGIIFHSVTGDALGGAWRDGRGREIADDVLRNQIADAEAARGLVVGPPLSVSAELAPLVLASRALASRSGLTTVLTLALRPDQMPFLSDVRGLPPGSTISVVDVRGPLLARTSPLDVAAGPAAAGPAAPAPVREGGAERRAAPADDRVVGHAVATRAPWVVYVDTPAEVALIAARNDFVRDLALGALMLGFALLLAWLIAERITAPIRQLTADAAALGAGQLSRRTVVHSGDEIGVLARVFNEAAGAIERLVSDLWTSQTEVRALNAQLEQRVRDRTAQLAAINTELEAFSFSVSHDLRAPLRRIEAFSAALLEDFGDRLDEEGRLMLERLTVGSVQMSQLIDDLLRLSRVSQAELSYTRVDLSQLAAEVVAELRLSHPEHPVNVSIADALTATGDASLLRVVLQNLLANAWKFTRGRPDARVEIGTVTSEGVPTFFIRDNGVGFDPARAGKLFRPFQRLHDERDFEGTGIGLATVQRIIHRHGGRIWAEGQVGSGAAFWFTIPD